jgi:hypothetical protein
VKTKYFSKKMLSPGDIIPLEIIGHGSPYDMHTSTLGSFYYYYYQVSSISSNGLGGVARTKYFLNKTKLNPGAVTPLKIIGSLYNMHTSTLRSFFAPSFIKFTKRV